MYRKAAFDDRAHYYSSFRRSQSSSFLLHVEFLSFDPSCRSLNVSINGTLRFVHSVWSFIYISRNMNRNLVFGFKVHMQVIWFQVVRDL